MQLYIACPYNSHSICNPLLAIMLQELGLQRTIFSTYHIAADSLVFTLQNSHCYSSGLDGTEILSVMYDLEQCLVARVKVHLTSLKTKCS